MRRKTVFLDIDGTILGENTEITEKTRFAVSQARKRGNFVCIATGRCMAEVDESIRALDFDGYVCAAGAYLMHGERLVQAVYMEKEQLEKSIEVLEEAGCFWVLEGVEHLYVSRDGWKALKLRAAEDTQAARLVRVYSESVRLFCTLDEVSFVNKISYFWSKESVHRLREKAEKLGLTLTAFSMDWAAGESGELTLKGCHKGEGILRMARCMETAPEDVIAIGDSANDVEMLRAAGTGIAMGNASEDVKALADEVTGSVADDGVYEAFLRHGLCPVFPGEGV